ncbi:MAG: GNAT family N-acetyltransferase [Gemmatimonadaceae bacterium]|nr:GNAT family N-acetyltransferase [Gemmatimonadaceae bacterium]
MPSVADVVQALRAEPVRGHVIDLVPYAAEHHDTIIALRNTERASYFLHQPAPLTRESQARWFEGYLGRSDDIQWAIVTKQGDVLGATALYGITDDRSRGEKGRLVMDDARGREGPYTLEAELLLLDVAFDRVGLERVDTCVRHDNGVMQSINARLGFERTGEHDIRGVPYFDYSLTPVRYTPAALRATAAAWARRGR